MYGQIQLSLDEAPRLSIRDVLSYVSEENIISHYLGISKIQSGNYHSPFRDERRPSFTLRYDHGKIKFHDHGDGFDGDIFDVLQKLYNKSLPDTIFMIYQEMIKGKSLGRRQVEPRVMKTTKSVFKPLIRTYNDDDLAYWKDHKISKNTLEKYQVYPLKSLYLSKDEQRFERIYHDRSKDPCYCYVYKDEKGKEAYKFYWPKRGSHKFLSNTPKSIIQGEAQLERPGDDLVITKSLKDVMALSEFGIQSIAPNAESVHISPDKIEQYKQEFKRIISLYDYDRAGMHGAWLLRKDYGIPAFMFGPSFAEKDFAEFCKNHTEREIENLILNIA